MWGTLWMLGAHDFKYSRGGDTWAWWLEHGFDGIAGGLVGGLAAGATVWFTLKHNRKMVDKTAEEQRQLQEVAGGVAEAARIRDVVAELSRSASLKVFDAPVTPDDDRWSQWRTGLFIDLLLAQAQVRQREKQLAKDLWSMAPHLSGSFGGHKKVDVERAVGVAHCIAMITTSWLMGTSADEELELFREKFPLKTKDAEVDVSEVIDPNSGAGGPD